VQAWRRRRRNGDQRHHSEVSSALRDHFALRGGSFLVKLEENIDHRKKKITR
jgi:hypothetical protein